MVNRGGVGAIVARVRAAILLSVLALGGGFLLRHDFSQMHSSRPARMPVAEAQAQLASLPLAFEPNQGQSVPQVKFLTHGSGYGLFLTQDEADLALPALKQASSATASNTFRMRFAGANTRAEMAAVQPLPGRTNYLLGNDSSRWIRNVPQFARVRYTSLYPGVDLDFYGKQGRLEYDFEVNPGADPQRINLQFPGTTNVRIASGGDLVIALEGREVRFHAPHIYQASATGNQDISGGFVLRAGNQVGFEVGNYNRNRTLVIDPVLSFSTYFGGSGQESCSAITGAALGFVPHCPAIAIDSAHRVYLTGATQSPTVNSGFPTPTSPVTTIPPASGNSKVFVARISSNGSALILDFLTFVGGTGTDYPVGVGIDSGFNIYVAGNTSSGDFPVTSNTAFQASVPAPGNHVFFAQLNSSASALLYSTFLAGNGVDTAADMALDNQGQAYIFGTTTSTAATTHFPTTIGSLQPSAAAADQFFLSKLNPNLTGSNSLLYSTFFGGSTPASGVVLGGGVAVDSDLNVYMAGGTNFTDMPVVNAFQGTEQSGLDVWAAKLAAPANNTQQYTPVYETYFGGGGDEVAYGVAADSGNTNMYITGSTTSSGLAAATGTTPLQANYAGGTDAFLTKFGALTVTGTTQGSVQLAYFTYLGGAGQDDGLSIVTDANQNAYIAGLTTSGSLPNANSSFPSVGGTDAFFSRLVTTGTSSTTANTSSTGFLGGSGTDIGTSIAVDSNLSSYIAGETASNNFPLSSAPNITPLQTSLSGNSDAFVSKISPTFTGLTFNCTASGCPSAANPVANPSPVGVGNTTTFTYSIFNFGDPVNGAVFTSTAQNSTITQASASPGTCTISGTTTTGTSATCNMGTIPTSVTTTTTTGPNPTTVGVAATVTITVTANVPTPPTPPQPLSNAAVLSVVGANFQATKSGSANVSDFGISVSGQNTQTITAGNQGTYTLLVKPTAPFPESVSLACGPLPSGAQCAFQGANPITNLTSAQNRILDITTTPRVTTPASLFRTGPVYAFWLPVSGFALIGSGLSRRRRWMLVVLIGALLGGISLQAGCSSSSGTSTTNGTPAGTYTISINATSGTATRTTAVTLVVQ